MQRERRQRVVDLSEEGRQGGLPLRGLAPYPVEPPCNLDNLIPSPHPDRLPAHDRHRTILARRPPEKLVELNPMSLPQDARDGPEATHLCGADELGSAPRLRKSGLAQPCTLRLGSR